VQTAVWTLTHPATGRTVTLVGTMHIGDGPFFRDLSGLLAGLAADGAEIHVEGIARRDGDCLNEWEEDRLAEAETSTCLMPSSSGASGGRTTGDCSPPGRNRQPRPNSDRSSGSPSGASSVTAG
jgi:hypothetical protein